MPRHGSSTLAGLTHAALQPATDRGKFRRMFLDLPPATKHSHNVLRSIGAADGSMGLGGKQPHTSSSIPLGFVFLGQFIDHEITLDVTSSLDRANDPEQITNFRTPALDLDSVYGQGTEASRHLYDHQITSDDIPSWNSDNPSAQMIKTAPQMFEGILFATGETVAGGPGTDLARGPKSAGSVALIGDFRNDENRLLSQLHLQFLKFHNNAVWSLLNGLSGVADPKVSAHALDLAVEVGNKIQDGQVGKAREELFDEAQRLTRWHYQWVVVHDYLRKLCGDEIVDDVLNNGRKLFLTNDENTYLPIEFAAAVFRYGHTQVPTQRFTVTDIARFDEQFDTVFGDNFGHGFEPPNDNLLPVSWTAFFGKDAQKADAVDINLAFELLNLPIPVGGAMPERSLAVRNMLRGQTFDLPSGQTVASRVAAATGGIVNTPDLVSLLDGTFRHPVASTDGQPFTATGEDISAFVASTPLWFYILAEGTLVKNPEDNLSGQRLGPVGGRIVAEVILGILDKDPTSYRNAETEWRPELISQADQPFTMLDFCNFAKEGALA